MHNKYNNKKYSWVRERECLRRGKASRGIKGQDECREWGGLGDVMMLCLLREQDCGLADYSPKCLAHSRCPKNVLYE